MDSKAEGFFRSAKQWKDEMTELRAILRKTKLDEEFKWRLPCYSADGKNIAIIQPFKKCLGLMFFKGALLKDSKKLLVANGPNSHSSRRLEFRSIAEVKKLAPAIKAFVNEAMKAEAAGLKVEVKRAPMKLLSELKNTFAKNSKLKTAFDALTPGRQRAYLMHFSGAKQAATRQARIDKCASMILKGKGLNDR